MTKRLALAALLACALPAAAAQPPVSLAPAQKDAPFLIIDNTYYVGQSDPTAFLIRTSAGLVLLDVGYPADAALVEKNIQALGFKLSDVKLMLNSHGHYDHSGGLAKLRADTGARMVSSQGEVYALEKGVYPGSESTKAYDFPPVKVDRVVRDGEVVELGGVKFTAHLTPGHTKGCTSWTWPVKDRDGSAHTAIDFCSATVAANRLVPEQYPGMIADYRHTFATAKSIQADVFFAAHSGFFGLAGKKARLGQPGPNPFIDRAGFERLLDGQQKAFEAALAAAEKAKP
jgi:metallo-beta-lactamase class B